jgi:peptidoglycan/LPS O-acetylase OafA/YrhL
MEGSLMALASSTPGSGHVALAVQASEETTAAPPDLIPAQRDAPTQEFAKPERTPSRFRGDVAGLRAVAVGLVLLYHAGVRFLPGGFVGVDVFFVISGYLITAQLLAEIDRTGRISLPAFYARRAKRILPAAAIVLVATAGLVWLFVPRVQWQQIGGDIVSAATYVVNWRLAGNAVDYLTEDAPPSPVQHFWSLAVEEQFYIVWPLLIIAAIVVARIFRRTNVRPILWLGLVVVAVPSFAWSIVETTNDPGQAFFVSTTRMWELSIGAGVALVGAHWAKIPRSVATVIGWLGLAGVVASGFLITGDTAWPGYAAALPTLGAAAVIAGGVSASHRGPIAILGTRPFRWVGDLSYSLYLWHWPLIVVATAHWHTLSVERGLAVALLSIIPAWITYRLVENPLRYSAALSRSPRFALSIGGNFTLVGICAGLVLLLVFARSADATAGAHGPALGAAILAADPANDPAGSPSAPADFITPNPLKAGADLPDSYKDGCHQDQISAAVLSCTYGDVHSKTVVVLAGDSKAEQWLSAFQSLAKTNDWKLVVYIKSSCTFTSATTLLGDDASKPYPSCTQWNASLLQTLVAQRPTYVVTSQDSATALDANGRGTVDAMVAGMRATWSALAAVGSKVVVIANNPHPTANVDQCVDQHRNNLSSCAFSRTLHDKNAAYLTQKKAVSGVPSVKMIDLFDAICPTATCAPVIGNVLIYRQGSHMTSTYVKTMAPRVATALAAVGVPAH